MTRRRAPGVLAALALAASPAGARPSPSPPPPPPSPALATLAAAPAPCPPDRGRCVELAVHVAVVDGAPVATPAWLAAQVATANTHLATIDLGVQVARVTALPAAAAHVRSRADRSALATRARRGVIDVFVTARLDDVDGDGALIRGVAWRAGGHKYVILATYAMDRVLAHELGHVLGLAHSTDPASLMNKTPRLTPPLETWSFPPAEQAIMRRALARLLRAGVVKDLRAGAR